MTNPPQMPGQPHGRPSTPGTNRATTLYRRIWRRLRNRNDRIRWLEGFDATRSIFIHVPKAAGTSIGMALYGEDPWHHTALEYRRSYPGEFKQYFTFSFVRNPFARLLSTYRYSFIQKRRHPTTSVGFVTAYPTFESFIMDWIVPENTESHYFFLPQTRYLTDGEGRFLIDFLGRVETIEEDFRFVRLRLGMEAALGHFNATGHEDYHSHYTPEMVKRVEDAYAEDLTILGYRY